MITIIISAIISAITAKIVATYYFEKADGYVKEMCEMTEKNNKETINPERCIYASEYSF